MDEETLETLTEKVEIMEKEKTVDRCINLYDLQKELEMMNKMGYEVRPRKLQQIYDDVLRTGVEYMFDRVVNTAKDRWIELKENAEALQEGYERKLRKGNEYVAIKIEEYAKKCEIELRFNAEALQEGYEFRLAETENLRCDLWSIKEYAKEKGVELGQGVEILQQAYEKYLRKGWIFQASLIEYKATKNNVSLRIEPEALQEGHDNIVGRGGDNMREFKEYLKKKGIEDIIPCYKTPEIMYS